MAVSYLQLEGVTKSYGDRLLFADITLGVFQGDKIGLIAQNGTGKTTLLRIIAGAEDLDSGSVTFRSGLRIGYLPQEPVFDPELSPVENLLAGADPERVTEDLVRVTLGSVGIRDLDVPVARMSGGQVKRAAIARAVLDDPDLLILDEPTNHLDIETIEWLQDYLSRSKATLLMVTHDRYFLDNVCNKIVELDDARAYTYQGNYDYYLRRRAERLTAENARQEKIRNLLRTELDWMRRQPQARGSKAKYRIDSFHELQSQKADLTRRSVSLDVRSSYIGSKIFEAHGISKAFGDKTILRDWSYTFARYDKVGIVGPNGVGKSTLIKLLLGRVAPDTGRFEIGETVRWGYYAQEGISTLDPRKRVIDAAREIAEDARLDDGVTISASSFLTRFLFSYADQQKYIEKLSGGEKRRLYLATVLMRQPNFLILDEPTNDLDILTLTVLEEYLAGFKGCVMVVSHDRCFLDKTVDHLFVLTGDGSVRDFPGDYSTYRHCLLNEQKAARAEKPREAAKPRQRTETRQRLTFKEKKEYDDLSDSLPALQARKEEIERQLAGVTDHAEITRLAAELSALADTIDSSEMRLLELMEKDPTLA